MRVVVLSIAAFFAFVFFAGSCSENKTETLQGTRNSIVQFERQMDTLITEITVLDSMLAQMAGATSLQQQFHRSRAVYKRAEAITEYYFQGLVRRINGPALPDVKTEDGVVWPPHGFQVIEQLLFADYHDSLRKTVSEEAQLLLTDIRFVKANMAHNAILPRHAYELLQHEIIRIATLGITGFDAPVSFAAIPETAAALEGIRLFCQVYFGDSVSAKLNTAIDACIGYLGAHNDFNAFNRLEFITTHLMPLSRLLDVYRLQQTDTLNFSAPYSGSFADLMEGRSWNPDFYAPYAKAATNKEKVALGKLLFNDQRLSASGKISCASCHKEGLSLTDGLAKANNLVHGGSLPRNSPTLYYAALQAAQFYDMRSTSLEDQINDVMQNSNEFALEARSTAEQLLTDSFYRKALQKVYGEKNQPGGYEIRNAIAAYVRSLNPFASRFDKYIRGDRKSMSEQEVNGFNLFMGKAKCGTCHFMPLFNGTTPPWFSKSESEIIGVPERAVWNNARIDKDSGRYKINAIRELLFAFKTPGLRNISTTAPYMHNGVYTNLEDVVEFYNKGGGTGIGIDLPSQTLPFDSLSLTVGEKKAIVAFLGTLTDER